MLTSDCQIHMYLHICVHTHRHIHMHKKEENENLVRMADVKETFYTVERSPS